jgi:putative membrane protein
MRENNKIKYSLAGFFMGVAELIPGISGATVAVIFKIYPNLMTILSKLRIKHLSFSFLSLSKTFQFDLLLPLIFSMIAAIILCSKAINFLLNNYEENFLTFLGCLMIILSLQIINFFKGILHQKKLFIFIFLGTSIGFILGQLDVESENISIFYLILSGVLAFSFFLIPGISGSSMLVVLGIYSPIIGAIANFNFDILIPFALGCLISLLLLPRLILSIYSSYEQSLLYLFSGLIASSGLLLL